MPNIRLHNGSFALVDACDFQELSPYKWHLSEGYPTRSIRHGKTTKHVRMHTAILGCLMVDHRNRNKLDNRRVNPRPASKSLNAYNTNSPGRGVYYHKKSGKWAISLSLEDKTLYFGLFKEQREALTIAALPRASLIYHELTKGKAYG